MNQLFTPTTNLAECRRILVDGVHFTGIIGGDTNTKCYENMLELETCVEIDHTMVQRIDMGACGDPLIANFNSGIEESITASSARFAAMAFSTRRFS